MEKLNDTKLKEILLTSKSKIDIEWSSIAENSLKEFTLSDQKEYTNNNLFIYKIMKNKVLIASVITVAIFVVAVSAFSVYYLAQLKKGSGYSKEDTLAILSKVLANNSVSTIQEGAALSPARNAGASDMASSLTIAPIIDDFNGANYRYTRTSITAGPAASKCENAFNFDKVTSISDTYEFRPNGGSDYRSYMYKYVTYSANNQITNLSVSKYEGNNSIYFDYAGGSYAVRNVYDQGPTNVSISPLAGTAVLDEAVSGPTTPEESQTTEPDYETLVTQYFGPDAKIVGTVSENGKTYYVLRYSYSLLCNNVESTVVYENKINSETYSILDTKTYLGSADAANLMSSTTVTVETKTITEAEANSIFTLGVNVPVKDVIYPYIPAEEYSAEKEATRTIDALKSTQTYVLIPETYTISYGYSYVNTTTEPTNSNYRADRAFYPSGSLGDDLFKLYNPTDVSTYLTAESNFNFVKDDGNTTMYIESFEKGTTIAQVSDSKSNTFSEVQNKSAENIVIKINGVNVNATLLTFTATQNWYYLREGVATSSNSGVSSDSRIMAPDSAEESTYDYAYIIFEYNGHVYSASKDVYTGTKVAASDLNLKAYNPNNTSDYNFIKTALLEVANRPIPVDPGIGDGSTGSGSTDIACTMDAKVCPDGSYVGRNPKLNCEFDACP